MKGSLSPKRLIIIGYIGIPLLLILFLVKDRLLTPKTVIYENTEYQFEIAHPKDWVVNEKPTYPNDKGFFCESEIVTLTSSSKQLKRTIDVDVYQPKLNCPNRSLEDYLDQALRQLVIIQTGKPVKNLEKLTCDPTLTVNQSQITCQSTTLGGQPAYKLTFIDDQQQQREQYLTSQGDYIYLLTYKVDPTKAINFSGKDARIIKSFRFGV